METTTIIQLIDKYGLATGVISLIAVFLYRQVWPLLLKRSEIAEAFLEDQIKHAQDKDEKLTAEFMAALKQAHDNQAAQMVGFEKLALKLDNLSGFKNNKK